MMKSGEVYARLDKEFEIERINEDEWSSFDLGDFATESFRTTWKGLVLDNTTDVRKVYSAVFPSEIVLDQIITSGVEDALLFTHHPMIWDRSLEGLPFRNIPKNYLEKMKQNRISMYTIHVPLDRNGPFSTTASLARVLEIETTGEFFDYFGSKVGIIGKTDCSSTTELSEKIERVVEHQVKVYMNGPTQITNQMVALVAGGGNFPEVAEELAETDVKIYITGIGKESPTWEPSLRFHEICRENNITIFAATHYSTEKFACIAILKFFEKLGLENEFLKDKPDFRDY